MGRTRLYDKARQVPREQIVRERYRRCVWLICLRAGADQHARLIPIQRCTTNPDDFFSGIRAREFSKQPKVAVQALKLFGWAENGSGNETQLTPKSRIGMRHPERHVTGLADRQDCDSRGH